MGAGSAGGLDPTDFHRGHLQPGEKGVSVLARYRRGHLRSAFHRAGGRLRADCSPAMAIVAITLCEGQPLVRQYSRKHGYKADSDQVLFADGAEVAAGLSGAWRRATVLHYRRQWNSAGLGSQLPSMIAAGTIALVMLFFTDMLAFLPNAALAGIVANAVLSLIEVGELRRAVPDAPQRVLDRRCVPAERVLALGPAAGRQRCFPAGHHRCRSGEHVQARHLGSARSPGRQPFCAHGDGCRAR